MASLMRPAYLPLIPISLILTLTIVLSGCGQNPDPSPVSEVQPPESAIQSPVPEVETVEDTLKSILTEAGATDASEVVLVTEASTVTASDGMSLQYMESGIAPMMPPAAQPTVNRENYHAVDDNPVHRVSADPVSTFSVDVDTGSYANVRRFIQNGALPPADAVRIEEMLNYFSYDYPVPQDRAKPFNVSTEVVPTPWNQNTLLMRVGIKAYDIDRSERPAANLVFLLDVSGSMNDTDKLPLLISAFKLLTDQLTERDRIAIVVYAGAAGVVLEPVAGDQTATIRAALERLSAGGSTNGGEGIQLAYALAQQSFIEGGINRVLLATDGDMNMGTAGFDGLLDMIKKQREGGVSLTTLGFGQGNYNDHLLEQLADQGNGNSAYIDSFSEARKVLVTELSSTLFTVASDVKIQIEFNPATVAEYRLIGYENRMLREEDFTNDRVDAGDIGASHTVTALYEIALMGSNGLRLEPRRYDTTDETAADVTTVTNPPNTNVDELAFVRLRYKMPGEEQSAETRFPMYSKDVLADFDQASPSTRFAATVAAFGQILKGGRYTENMSLGQVMELARNATGEDPHGYRREFVELVELVDALSTF